MAPTFPRCRSRQCTTIPRWFLPALSMDRRRSSRVRDRSCQRAHRFAKSQNVRANCLANTLFGPRSRVARSSSSIPRMANASAATERRLQAGRRQHLHPAQGLSTRTSSSSPKRRCSAQRILKMGGSVAFRLSAGRMHCIKPTGRASTSIALVTGRGGKTRPSCTRWPPQCGHYGPISTSPGVA